MEREKYIEDLREIRMMMSKSSKFISLSGLSGVAAGIVGLLTAYIAYVYLLKDHINPANNIIQFEDVDKGSLVILGIFSVVLAISLGIYFTHRKALKESSTLWNKQSQLLLSNMAIPLVAGGILILILLSKGYAGLVAPLTLIFYGLSLVHASNYTLDDIKYLGFLEIFLGLIAAYFIGYGLLFWTIGFGILHILYGWYMYIKYK